MELAKPISYSHTAQGNGFSDHEAIIIKIKGPGACHGWPKLSRLDKAIKIPGEDIADPNRREWHERQDAEWAKIQTEMNEQGEDGTLRPETAQELEDKIFRVLTSTTTDGGIGARNNAATKKPLWSAEMKRISRGVRVIRKALLEGTRGRWGPARELLNDLKDKNLAGEGIDIGPIEAGGDRSKPTLLRMLKVEDTKRKREVQRMIKGRMQDKGDKAVRAWHSQSHKEWWRLVKAWEGGLVTPTESSEENEGQSIKARGEAIEKEAAKVYAKATRGPHTFQGDRSKWWQDVTQKKDLDPEIWKPLEEVVEEPEFEAALTSIRCTTAGRSGITAGLMKVSSATTKEAILDYVNTCMREGVCGQRSLNVLQVHLQKPGYEGKGLEKTRPIGVSEALHMVLEKILSKRLSKILHENSVLHPMQSGFVTDGGAVDTCWVTKTVQEDCANDQDKALHMMSTDIRGAFNAPQWWAVKAALERLSLPANIISLLMATLTGTTTQVLTGLDDKYTTGFTLTAGTVQGRGISPLLWIILFDMVICDIDKNCGQQGYKMRDGATIWGEGLADDLTLLARTKKGIKALYTRFALNMDYLNIEISVPKTIYMPYGHGGTDLVVDRVDRTPETVEHRDCAKVSGVFINARDESKWQIGAVREKVKSIEGYVAQIPVTLTQQSANLIFNSKLRSALIYKLRTTNVTPAQVDEWDIRLGMALKKKARWKKTVAHSIFDMVATQGSLKGMLIQDRLKTWLAARMAPDTKQDKATDMCRQMWDAASTDLTWGHGVRTGNYTTKQNKHSLVANTMTMLNNLMGDERHWILGVTEADLALEADDIPLAWLLPPRDIAGHRHAMMEWSNTIVSEDGKLLDLKKLLEGETVPTLWMKSVMETLAGRVAEGHENSMELKAQYHIAPTITIAIPPRAHLWDSNDGEQIYQDSSEEDESDEDGPAHIEGVRRVVDRRGNTEEGFEYEVEGAQQEGEEDSAGITRWIPFTQLGECVEAVNEYETGRAKALCMTTSPETWEHGKARAWIKSGDILQDYSGTEAITAVVASPALIEDSDDVNRQGRTFKLHLQAVVVRSGAWWVTGIHYIDALPWNLTTTRWRRIGNLTPERVCIDIPRLLNGAGLDGWTLPTHDEKYGVIDDEKPWWGHDDLSAMGDSLRTEGSRVEKKDDAALQRTDTIFVVSDASFVKHEDEANEGSVALEVFADEKLTMPIWSLSFNIPGSPSSSTVCEGEAVGAVMEGLKGYEHMQVIHHMMDNMSVPCMIDKGDKRRMRTKKDDREAFLSKEQFLWPKIRELKAAAQDGRAYYIHWVAGHMDDEDKRTKIEAKLIGESPADRRMQVEVGYMAELGLDRGRLEQLNQIQDEQAEVVRQKLPKQERGRLPRYFNLMHDGSLSHYTIMEDPILEMIDALSLEHKIDKVRRQLQWEHITGEGVSEEVLVEWLVSTGDGNKTAFACHGVTKNLPTQRSLSVWYPATHSSQCLGCEAESETITHAILDCPRRHWDSMEATKTWERAIKKSAGKDLYRYWMTTTGPAWWSGRATFRTEKGRVLRALQDEWSGGTMQHRTFMIPPDMVREVRSLEGTQARATLVKMQDALITITQTAWEQRRMQTLTSRREGRGRGRQRDTVDTTVGKKRKKTVKNVLHRPLEKGQTTLDAFLATAR